MTPARLSLALVLVAAALAALPGIAAAAPDPNHVSFTLEGCRPGAPFTPPPFVCPNADYTTGNLGKFWNEGDLVPYRFTADSKGAQDQTYSFDIAADYRLGNALGYDFISAPVLNAGLSDAGCTAPANVGGLQYAPPDGAAAGGADQTIFRKLDITQKANTVCVYDYVMRLALPDPTRLSQGTNTPAPLGASAFPGSSLHGYLFNQNLTSSGIGEKRVPIPVNTILPQKFSKEVAGVRGLANAWSVAKNAGSVNLANTCAAPVQATVDVTVSWTKTAVPPGSTTVTTKFIFDNPAHRTLGVSIDDVLYSDAAHTNQIDSFNFTPAGGVAPGHSEFTVTKNYTAAQLPAIVTTLFNTATAHYSDPVVGGSLGAINAQASGTIANGAAGNDTATISDSESITGSGLEFSVDAPSSGSFTGYTAGTHTTGPVVWESGTVNSSGSITFHKTIYAAQGTAGSGSLDDTATLKPADSAAQTASASIPIATSGCTPPAVVPPASTPGEQGVAGVTVTPGSARLAGKSGCVARAFFATVKGKQISKVVFTIDGKRKATVTKPDSKGRFKLKVDPKKFKPGSHLLVAKTSFTAASNTKAKTLRLRFARCVRRTSPAFTG